jgi:hypothetical protein
MKKFMLFALSLYSSLSFSQSMMVMNNGKIVTVDNAGVAFDLGNFQLPYEIKYIGGRYLIDKDRKVHTVDRNGLYIKKLDSDKVPSDIEVLGENYFISKRGTLYTIDDTGFFYEVSKEREYRNVTAKGGNFFIAEKRDDGKKFLALFVVNSAGQVSEVKVNGLNVGSVNYAGGTYFTTSMGELFTVSADGFVYSKKDMGKFNGWHMKRGHNYFTYQSKIFTVTSTNPTALLFLNSFLLAFVAKFRKAFSFYLEI